MSNLRKHAERLREALRAANTNWRFETLAGVFRAATELLTAIDASPPVPKKINTMLLLVGLHPWSGCGPGWAQSGITATFEDLATGKFTQRTIYRDDFPSALERHAFHSALADYAVLRKMFEETRRIRPGKRTERPE